MPCAVLPKLAMERKTGARGLRSIVERCLLDTMYTLPDLKDVAKVIINKEVVEKAISQNFSVKTAANISNKAHSPKKDVYPLHVFFIFLIKPKAYL